MDLDQGKLRPVRQLDWTDLKRRSAEPRAGRVAEQPSAGVALRALQRRQQARPTLASHPLAFCGRVTLASLRLEGLDVEPEQVIKALLRHDARGELRSRMAQMIRNHVAIQRSIHLALRRQFPLRANQVLGWYASLSGGLPVPSPAADTLRRLEDVCRRVNSPPMQLATAVQDVARLYCELLSDALVPSYNGVLARLVMGYHLGRCGLPPVVVDAPLGLERNPQQAYAALLQLLEARAQEVTT